ncbi:TRADD-N-associated membrane domain-containing protein [Vibrio parahaemolyticus]|uniref:TRADD-N-associated membrane domain-containing protein n=1 Tax=Vibrionaceae TaxID=641 RepID=UPI001599B449|nr:MULTISPECIES: hypothetical protein [Vibrionaceae]EGQ8523118.1 hypothetical protein [Vibrio parahaemolyticus]EHR1005905.1 hypothetical protein [Vibrio parahaemolyticus]EIU6865372.1 hypothetical protein [Vibrio parahaemolyticus]EIU7065947.1 hypothetical protein [Vibrio parahaemolyticus]EJL7832928.1 hypothetical protein [Vibrio vulnificus]
MSLLSGIDPKDLIGGIAAAFSVAVAFGSLAGALKAGVLKRVRFGAFEIEASAEDANKFKDAFEKGREQPEKVVPFEIEQLANYYSQILSQSKVSFWFSMIFASLGFAIIVISAFLHTDGSGTATIAQFTAGIIMDAVAGLFFVQSRNAQKSMGEFFDKLRNDRLHAESKIISGEIRSQHAQDALRLHLALHYAGVPSSEAVAKHITEECLRVEKAA